MSKTALRWAKIVAEWKASGLRAAAFARIHKLDADFMRKDLSIGTNHITRPRYYLMTG